MELTHWRFGLEAPIRVWMAARMTNNEGTGWRRRRLGHSSQAVWVAGILATGLLVQACDSAKAPTIPTQSPVQTAVSWFDAINARNLPLAKAHFAAADRDQMDWSSSELHASKFSGVRCNATEQGDTTATVRCTFNPMDTPRDMKNVTFWSIDMEQTPPGPWLITNYGQG